jgi:hypothetical protein
MNEQDKREIVQVAALQLLYFLGQREKGRFLDNAEMRAAMATADEFMAWYFGDKKRASQ